MVPGPVVPARLQRSSASLGFSPPLWSLQTTDASLRLSAAAASLPPSPETFSVHQRHQANIKTADNRVLCPFFSSSILFVTRSCLQAREKEGGDVGQKRRKKANDGCVGMVKNEPFKHPGLEDLTTLCFLS